MKGVSLATGLEIEIEPFVIDVTSPYSTAPSIPVSDFSDPKIWSNPNSDKISDTAASSSPLPGSVTVCSDFNFFSEIDGENLLDFLFSPTVPTLSLFEALVRDSSPASRAAILYYLPLSPVTQRDISTLVPSLLHDAEIMTSLAMNIGYYHAHDFISSTELEYRLMQILTCGDAEGEVYQNLDDRLLHLYHLTQRQVEQYRAIIVSPQKLQQEANHQKLFKKNVQFRQKNWRRKRTAARMKLPLEAFIEPGVPLPYGCTTLADVFTDVNEMYDPYAKPSVDWAQTRPSSYNSIGIECHRKPLRVNLPGRDAYKPEVKIVGLVGEERVGEGALSSKTQASFKSLYPCASEEVTVIVVKLPPNMCASLVELAL